MLCLSGDGFELPLAVLKSTYVVHYILSGLLWFHDMPGIGCIHRTRSPHVHLASPHAAP